MALLRAFRQSMAQLKLSGRLVATDITDTSPALCAADVGVIVPTVDKPEYAMRLLQTVKKYRVKLLVPLTDLDLLCLAHLREQFAELGCTVMIGSVDALTTCMDKSRTNAVIKQAGLAVIGTHTLKEFLQAPFYPCFIKPIRGSAGVGAAVIKNHKQLEAHVGRFSGPMLLQEYVPGQEFTIDVYRTRQGEVKCAVPRQRLVVRSGEVEKGMTVNDRTLIESAIKLSTHLGDLWGVFCCQCRRTEEGEGPPRFFEINPRFGGGAPLSIAAGANLPLYLLQEVTGRRVTAKLGAFKHHLLMLRYEEALFIKAKKVDSLPGFNTPFFR